MYYRKIAPVNELIRYLQEQIGELQAIGEDEIVAVDLEVLTVKDVIWDIIYDKEQEEQYSNLEECLNSVPPHIILDYTHYPKDEAKSDGYWDNYQDIKNDIWRDNIYPRIKDQLVEKSEKKEESDEIKSLDED